MVPNSHENFTKITINSSWGWFEHCSESLFQPLGSYTRSLLITISHEKLTKTVIRSSWSRLKYFSKSLVHEIPPNNLGLNFYFMTLSYKLSHKSQLSLWHNLLARSTVNRKVCGSSRPKDVFGFCYLDNYLYAHSLLAKLG